LIAVNVGMVWISCSDAQAPPAPNGDDRSNILLARPVRRNWPQTIRTTPAPPDETRRRPSADRPGRRRVVCRGVPCGLRSSPRGSFISSAEPLAREEKRREEKSERSVARPWPQGLGQPAALGSAPTQRRSCPQTPHRVLLLMYLCRQSPDSPSPNLRPTATKRVLFSSPPFRFLHFWVRGEPSCSCSQVKAAREGTREQGTQGQI
jgi:hypothetical protein